jgi:hypothetical protein
MDEMLQQSIIHAMHLFPERVRSVKQKPAQGLWVRKIWQAGQVLEGTVGA